MRTEEFWDHVDQSAGPEACWPWMLSRRNRGYGRVRWDGKMTGAHRIAYLLSTRQEPGDLFVLHSCDNPPCCNPAHLRLGTMADNMADKAARGRASVGAGNGSKLTEGIVREARDRAARGESIASLARGYGVVYAPLWFAIRGTTWRHVPQEPL